MWHSKITACLASLLLGLSGGLPACWAECGGCGQSKCVCAPSGKVVVHVAPPEVVFANDCVTGQCQTGHQHKCHWFKRHAVQTAQVQGQMVTSVLMPVQTVQTVAPAAISFAPMATTFAAPMAASFAAPSTVSFAAPMSSVAAPMMTLAAPSASFANVQMVAAPQATLSVAPQQANAGASQSSVLRALADMLDAKAQAAPASCANSKQVGTQAVRQGAPEAPPELGLEDKYDDLEARIKNINDSIKTLGENQKSMLRIVESHEDRIKTLEQK